jgi:hypothetical protein
MLWKKEVQTQQLFLAPNYIDVRVTESPSKILCLTCDKGIDNRACQLNTPEAR